MVQQSRSSQIAAAAAAVKAHGLPFLAQPPQPAQKLQLLHAILPLQGAPCRSMLAELMPHLQPRPVRQADRRMAAAVGLQSIRSLLKMHRKVCRGVLQASISGLQARCCKCAPSCQAQ